MNRPKELRRHPLRIDRILSCEREEAYRRALKQAGYLPQSVDIMVERDRDWIQSGDWNEGKQ